MKFTQFTTQETDGSNTWEAIVQEANLTEGTAAIKVWYSDNGYVEISVDDQRLAHRTFATKGQEATELEAIKFTLQYFRGLSNKTNNF